MLIPPALAEEWRHEPEWIAVLPRLAAECAEQWGLDLEKAIDTPHSLVVPAGEVVLKVNAPSHFEADHEAEALDRWDGEGAVRVLARDDARRAFVTERCRPGTALSGAGVDELAVVGELLTRLSLSPPRPHPFRLLAEEAERWFEDVPRLYELGGRPFERPLLDFALDVFGSAERDAGFLINQDLHGGNVLRAEREPWLLIDPKPLVGERELDGVGLLRNAAWSGESPTVAVRRCLDILQGLALDRERLRGWGVAHALAWGWDDTNQWSLESIEAARMIRAA